MSDSLTAHFEAIRKDRNICEGCGWIETEEGERYCPECEKIDSLTQPEVQEILSHAA